MQPDGSAALVYSSPKARFRRAGSWPARSSSSRWPDGSGCGEKGVDKELVLTKVLTKVCSTRACTRAAVYTIVPPPPPSLGGCNL
jgi:hypothetical protein